LNFHKINENSVIKKLHSWEFYRYNLYYRIVHSVRKGKKVISKTVLQIGKLDDKKADLVKTWLKEFPIKIIRKRRKSHKNESKI